MTDPAAISQLALELNRDDGAAVYLNGVEIVRDNLAPSASFNQFALTTAGVRTPFDLDG